MESWGSDRELGYYLGDGGEGIIAAESEITETLGANRLIHPHHRVWICFLSSTSCVDFGTRF